MHAIKSTKTRWESAYYCVYDILCIHAQWSENELYTKGPLKNSLRNGNKRNSSTSSSTSSVGSSPSRVKVVISPRSSQVRWLTYLHCIGLIGLVDGV